ncbi:UNVERIFIED_CONTAM: hypothetical protein FKN15_043436 [Acipenser sinensis]
MLACLGRQLSYENCRLPWARFSKENFQNNNFSFWAWIDGIRTLVKSYLEDLWNEGYIMGFVSKGKEKTLLKKQQHGTFLLRFSESCKDGAITFSWVDHFSNGKSNVRTVQPFTKNDLSQIPFVEILRNFQILVDENVPENPLKFLYPNIPKDDALLGRSDEKREGSDSKLPPIHRTSSTALHKGSQERYKEMIKRVQMPNSPNQIYRVPLTSGQQYGWWMPRANQTAIEKTESWMKITRQPRRNSEMTR